MRYRRADVAGGSYFFTVNLADRARTLLIDRADVLTEVMRVVRRTHPFRVEALVILPDHLHTIWTLPSGDADYPTRWMLIKAGFSRRIAKGERANASRVRKGGRGIWQRRYWEHCIRDEQDFARHVEYVHFNPVKHGYVRRASEWRYSSIHRYIAAGIVSSEWGGGEVDAGGEFGEGE